MTHICYKMHGAGNDFIIADNRTGSFPSDPQSVIRLCSRSRGIGGDGLILLGNPEDPHADLRMTFFNSDGTRAAMCGNGLRCAAYFASELMSFPKSLYFQTDAALLRTDLDENGNVTTDMSLIRPFEKIEIDGTALYIGDTGVPHAVIRVMSELSLYPVEEEGRFYRRHDRFSPYGVNVNFAHLQDDGVIAIRTYERGVESETDACGTGCAAVAAVARRFWGQTGTITLRTYGGDIISVDPASDPMRLTGPAVLVAKCELFPFEKF